MSTGNFKINADHWLEATANGKYQVDTQSYLATKNNTPFSKGEADSIVIHYTAGRNGKSSSEFLSRTNVKASAHLVVDRGGTVYQLVPFNKKSWHAGTSSYKDRKYYNNYSIGIELDNAGIMTPVGDKYKAWFGGKYLADDVVREVHRNEKEPRYWHTFTQEQIDICEEIVNLLIEKYPSMQERKEILGHEEISPGRKSDPGPAFPLDRLRDQAFSQDRAMEDAEMPDLGKVAVSKLNIRATPSAHSEKVAKPLQQGKEVKIIGEEGDWYEVATEVRGWVHKDYVETK